MWVSGYDYSIGETVEAYVYIYPARGVSTNNGYAVRFYGDSTYYMYRG